MSHTVVPYKTGFKLSPDDQTTDFGKLMSNFPSLIDKFSAPRDILTPDSQRVLIVENDATDLLRGQKLLAAYAAAKTMSPTAVNRVTVLLPPGRYDLGTGSSEPGILLDTDCIDLVGVDRELTVITSESGSAPTMKITAGDLMIASLTLQNRDIAPYASGAYWDQGGGSALVIRNVRFAGGSSMAYGNSAYFNGTYIDCVAGDNSFGYGVSGGVGGTFIRCKAGVSSFAGDSVSRNQSAVAGGTFIDCEAGDYSFGTEGGGCSGTFLRCRGGNCSFGGSCSGTFRDCRAGDDSFGAVSGTWDMSGKFYRCLAGERSFGSNGHASGLFVDCVAGSTSFGGASGYPTGTFLRCTAGDYSFGSLASGVFQGCLAGNCSFVMASDARFSGCVARAISFTSGGNSQFFRCLAEESSFTSSGIFQDCLAGGPNYGASSFGPNGGYVRCQGGSASFSGGIKYHCSINGGESL